MIRAVSALAAVTVFAIQSPVWACATCFGDPNDPQSQSLNAAIFTLLGVTYGLFGAMFVAGFVIWKRSRPKNSPEAAPAKALPAQKPVSAPVPVPVPASAPKL